MDISTASELYQAQLEGTKLARELNETCQISDQALAESEADLRLAKRAVQEAHRAHQLEALR